MECVKKIYHESKIQCALLEIPSIDKAAAHIIQGSHVT